jgi:hypothetical protein
VAVKSVIVVGILSLALGTTEAVAVSCPTVPTSGSAGTYLTASQIRSLLNGRYACVGTFPNATWNERHNGASGPVTDFKKGPSDPVDPSKQVGSFSVTGTSFPGNVQGPGYVTYTYLNGGGTYDYYINNSNNLATTTSSAPAGIYTFCTRTAGTTVDVNVNAGNSTTGGC